MFDLDAKLGLEPCCHAASGRATRLVRLSALRRQIGS
jgi:hypothetical protein